MAAAGGLMAVALAGCGRLFVVEREAWRGEAERQCLRAGVVKSSPYLRATGVFNGPGACGMDRALKVAGFNGGGVMIDREGTFNCPLVAATEAWLREVVQPAAQKYFGETVTQIRAGSYSCRGRNGRSGGKPSEHSFGNAIDIFSFGFASTRTVTVRQGWRGAPEEQNFLREIFVGACGRFSTVLAPGSDAFHYDHFHLDLARHASGRAFCRPVLKFEASDLSRAVPAPGPVPAPPPARPGFLRRLLPF
jgi:hypothetical protein